MIWGSLIVGASILLLMPTYVLLDTYKILAVVAFTLFGIGLLSTQHRPPTRRSQIYRTTNSARSTA